MTYLDLIIKILGRAGIKPVTDPNGRVAFDVPTGAGPDNRPGYSGAAIYLHLPYNAEAFTMNMTYEEYDILDCRLLGDNGDLAKKLRGIARELEERDRNIC